MAVPTGWTVTRLMCVVFILLSLLSLSTCTPTPSSPSFLNAHHLDEFGESVYPNRVLNRIAFGSCNKEHLPQPLWEQIEKHVPELFLWLGDIVYADQQILPSYFLPSSPSRQQRKFKQQFNREEYQKFLKTGISVWGIYDDHDYGMNDGGETYPYKRHAQETILRFLQEPEDSPRWKREGIFGARTYGPIGQRVTVIMLDVRYFRSGRDTLGGTQRSWLSKILAHAFETSQVVLIGSGSQILSTDKIISEKWGVGERRYLLGELQQLSSKVDTPPIVVLLSGDIHYAEILEMKCPYPLDNSELARRKHCSSEEIPYFPVVEATSSGLTHSVMKQLPFSKHLVPYLNKFVTTRHKIDESYYDLNFGMIDIDWSASPLRLYANIYNESNHLVISKELTAGQYECYRDSDGVEGTGKGNHMEGIENAERQLQKAWRLPLCRYEEAVHDTDHSKHIHTISHVLNFRDMLLLFGTIVILTLAVLKAVENSRKSDSKFNGSGSNKRNKKNLKRS